MPTYEYLCEACEHEFEKFQSITAPSIRKCPSCGKRKVRRKIGTGAAVIFKGSGFYQTDYRGESYKQAAAKDKAPSTDTSKSETKSETKSEAKPAAKSDSGKSSAKK